ncbi:PAS domain-containing protein [Rhodobacter capsulatus]|uniref:PAS domain-containing protein n=1 Tax=Rhodobacter capsulatus TaxID=1061 RepID=UPI0003D2F4F6|nr:PAS domain-containing protein [Rhodobacter capsulatus]ETD81088.1 histidine kinase [Rhodobacter capsulatus B6]
MTHQRDLSGQPEGEVNFRFDDLFFSRTDPRGVILAGNDVFQNVSGFAWSELLGAPHKIIRHPDTPRAVFRILWDALGNGFPMGGYVKNRARNGDFYWVFAVILPTEGGFLSVRLKPSTPLFAQIRKVYAELAARERAERLDPGDSARRLWTIITEAGFTSYTTFMASALGQELAARDHRLGRPEDPRTRRLIEMNEALERVTQEQKKLLRSFESLQSIPNNMRLVASRLEPSGGPVSAISENYRASSLVISDRLRSFVSGRENLCDRVSREVARALFLLGANRVMAEMIATFRQAEPVPGLDWQTEAAKLAEARSATRRDSHAALTTAVGHAEELARSSAEIRRLMLGLDTIRVMGRVECGRLRENGAGLVSTIDQLDLFHAEIKARLETILRLSEDIGSAMSRFVKADPDS